MNIKFTKPQDILLIVQPHRFKAYLYPLGLLYISNYLRKHGYDNLVVENKLLGGNLIPYKYQGKEKTKEDIITLDDYKEISFHHETKKFNKSKVDNLEELFSIWRDKLYQGIKWRNITHPFIYFNLLLTRPHKLERFDYIFFKFRRLIKYLLNKVGFNFSLRSKV